uniref:Peroxidase n=1 Tax=Caenorhabditis tropicalis TaxID=1561998 RepID=A0A1I7T008_9PELO
MLDEKMDFGFPQTTESRVLQEYITDERQKQVSAPRPLMTVTNAVSCNPKEQNEFFLDVIEHFNMLGTIFQSGILFATAEWPSGRVGV